MWKNPTWDTHLKAKFSSDTALWGQDHMTCIPVMWGPIHLTLCFHLFIQLYVNLYIQICNQCYLFEILDPREIRRLATSLAEANVAPPPLHCREQQSRAAASCLHASHCSTGVNVNTQFVLLWMKATLHHQWSWLCQLLLILIQFEMHHSSGISSMLTVAVRHCETDRQAVAALWSSVASAVRHVMIMFDIWRITEKMLLLLRNHSFVTIRSRSDQTILFKTKDQIAWHYPRWWTWHDVSWHDQSIWSFSRKIDMAF